MGRGKKISKTFTENCLILYFKKLFLLNYPLGFVLALILRKNPHFRRKKSFSDPFDDWHTYVNYIIDYRLSTKAKISVGGPDPHRASCVLESRNLL